MCPICSCMSNDAWLLESCVVSSRNFREGIVSSMLWALQCHFNCFQSFCHCSFSRLSCFCFLAAMLAGSGPHLKYVGRRSFRLVCFWAAFFASLSAFSFGANPSCPGTQRISTSHTPLVLAFLTFSSLCPLFRLVRALRSVS